MQLASAVALALTLCSCAGPSAPEAGPGATATAGLSTHAGTWQAVSYSFDYPADWTVTDTSEETGAGEVSVASPDGTVTAELVILIAWGAECPCVERPAVHLGDVDGAAPLSGSGTFTVRSVAMGLTDFPQERAENGWPDNVRVVTSLSSNPGPPPTSLVPRLMHGLGLVATDVVAANGETNRTILFTSGQDFATMEEARSYAASEDHRKVQAIIASFREGGGGGKDSAEEQEDNPVGPPGGFIY